MQLEGPVQIREVASMMVSSYAGVPYGTLFFRPLEHIKTDALQANCWDLEAKVILSSLCKKDLMWWTINVDQFPNSTVPMFPPG